MENLFYGRTKRSGLTGITLMCFPEFPRAHWPALGNGCSPRGPGHLLLCLLTTAQEALFQKALKNHRKGERGTIQIQMVKVRGEAHAAGHTVARRLLLVP